MCLIIKEVINAECIDDLIGALQKLKKLSNLT